MKMKVVTAIMRRRIYLASYITGKLLFIVLTVKAGLLVTAAGKEWNNIVYTLTGRWYVALALAWSIDALGIFGIVLGCTPWDDTGRGYWLVGWALFPW